MESQFTQLENLRRKIDNLYLTSKDSNTSITWKTINNLIYQLIEKYELKTRKFSTHSSLQKLANANFGESMTLEEIEEFNKAIDLAQDYLKKGITNLNNNNPQFNFLEKGNYRNKYQSFFFAQLKEKLLHIFSSQKHKNAKAFIANRYRIDIEDVDEFVTAFPTVFMSIVSSAYTEDYVSDLLLMSNPDAYTKDFKSKSNQPQKISKFEGLLLGHSINPYNEQLVLLLELGRFKLAEEVLGSPSHIIVTHPEWGKLNYSVTYLKNLGCDPTTIEENLHESLKFRIKLYEKLGFSEQQRNLRILEKRILSPYENIDKDPIKFAEQMKDYAEYGNLLKEYLHIEDLDKNSIVTLARFIDNIISNSPPYIKKSLQGSLKLLSLGIIDDTKNLKIIQVILNAFGSLTAETFEYVLLQRYAQHIYNNFLKLGTKSERSFDVCYGVIDRLDKLDQHTLYSLYFNFYSFSSKQQNNPSVQNAIVPYYFPTKSLTDKFPDLDEAEKQTIFIADSKTEIGKTKINNLINGLPISQVAIQLSDLFCFANYFFRKHESDFWIPFLELIQKFDGEVYDAWIAYISEREPYEKSMDFSEQNDKFHAHKIALLQEFGNNSLDITFDMAKLPYYYYPYVIGHYSQVKKDKELEMRLRQLFIDLTILVIDKVQNVFDYEGISLDWGNKLKSNLTNRKQDSNTNN